MSRPCCFVSFVCCASHELPSSSIYIVLESTTASDRIDGPALVLTTRSDAVPHF
jgi:hypothetical protein